MIASLLGCGVLPAAAAAGAAPSLIHAHRARYGIPQKSPKRHWAWLRWCSATSVIAITRQNMLRQIEWRESGGGA